MQPRSTVVLAGEQPLNKAQFDCDKKVSDEELAKVIAGDLWKKEESKPKKQ